jgi:hypothetical protein
MMHRTSPEALTRRSAPPSPACGRGSKTQCLRFSRNQQDSISLLPPSGRSAQARSDPARQVHLGIKKVLL